MKWGFVGPCTQPDTGTETGLGGEMLGVYFQRQSCVTFMLPGISSDK